jgi:hypothetical protein
LPYFVSLLNHLIRPLQERRWHRQAEGLGGLRVNDQLEVRGLPLRTPLNAGLDALEPESPPAE